MPHKYPVYIISKGRWENPLTAKYFEASNINYFIVVEPQEENEYIKSLGKERVLKLPFSNLGLGSFPARNYCWEHSKENGFKYHWIFDDNIINFYKWDNLKRRPTKDLNVAFSFIEQNAIKNNLDLSGFEEYNFCRKIPKKPFKVNTHIYSALLIKNDLPYRWRLKYNEDVDLCLQVLHNGGNISSCIYYMINKVSTSKKMKGGNQTELYKGNDPKKNLLKAKMLEAVWPQYTKTVIRFGRHHHLIDWKQFKKK
jgi:hypothetical protein